MARKRLQTRTVRKWFSGTVVVLLVLSLLAWYFTREPLPEEIAIATAEPGGLYYKIGEAMAPSIAAGVDRPVAVKETAGSESNLRLLDSGKAHLAIVQVGGVAVDDTAVITPLFPEPVHVVARKGRDIDSVRDLAGVRVAIGKRGSGMRRTALKLLRHYRLESEADLREQYFTDLFDDDSLDAAIVTTGVENPDLRRLLDSHQFKLLPIADARAIEMLDPYFHHFEIPAGLYSEGPPSPAEPVSTLATTAVLVARRDAPPALLRAALAAVHEEGLRRRAPMLIAREDALDWTPLKLHPLARDYFAPADRLGWVSSLMESLAATKELLFALGAGLYLLWERWRRLKEDETRRQVQRQKDTLDRYLEQTLRIERRQMHVSSRETLQDLLDEVTRIKLQALHELTDEDLRGDQMFAIFLMQCANLISKIQAKLIDYPASSPRSVTPS